MKLHLFEKNSEAYIRKSREYLEEANLARVEHQAAAEHHAALAKMYTERITRIEAEINHALQPHSSLVREPAAEESERSRPESVVAYPSRSTRP
ncbi:MAG: hypothetical protein M3R45_02810 [Pseudomonadota bacterium]|nr:hypothetical protein [Pseudomonadota bacterium]